jgi:Protein of unknown function (DUF3306)
MSDQENFLTRWSRRKQETAKEIERSEKPATFDANRPAERGEETNQTAAARAPAEANTPPAPEFDLSKLPTLESIGANSDIRPFLQAGVPSALKHAALRRAWSADPAIRDFIGPAENAWDFTAPDSMPGFGDLGPDVDVKKLVAEIFREVVPDAEPRADTSADTPAPEQAARLPDQSGSTADVPAADESAATERKQVAATSNDTPLLQRDEDIATQHNDSNESSPGIKPRRHGSATPQ